MSSLRKSAHVFANFPKSDSEADCSRAFWRLKRAFSTQEVEIAYRGGSEALGIIQIRETDFGRFVAVSFFGVHVADPLLLPLAVLEWDHKFVSSFSFFLGFFSVKGCRREDVDFGQLQRLA